MKPVILGMLVALVLPAHGMAMTLLCVETASTGFNWRDGAWVQANFRPLQHLIQDVTEDRSLAGTCTSTLKKANEWGSISAQRCWNISEVGDEKMSFMTSSCGTFYADGETVSRVNCPGGLLSFTTEAAGEFLLTRTYSAPDSNDMAGDRDSLVMAIGKCSVVAP